MTWRCCLFIWQSSRWEKFTWPRITPSLKQCLQFYFWTD
jgi:hypothetical protein